MRNNDFQLSHTIAIPSENSWESLFLQIKYLMSQLKGKLSGGHVSTIGLTISDRSCRQLLEGTNLAMLKDWLKEENLSLTYLNGCNYVNLKSCLSSDDYHKPDWNTQERVEYTKRLNRVLAVLLPSDQEGSVTTIPLSLTSWYKEQPGRIKSVYKTCAHHIASVVEDLLYIRREVGKVLFLNLQMLPSTLLESEKQFIDFYEKYLLPIGIEHLFKKIKLSPSVAEDAIRTHVRICLNTSQLISSRKDVPQVISLLKSAGIRIGRIQLENVLKAKLSGNQEKDLKIVNLISSLEDKNTNCALYNLQTKNNIYYQSFKEAGAGLSNVPEEIYINYGPPIFDKSYMILDTCQVGLKNMLQMFSQQKLNTSYEIGRYNEKIYNEIPEYVSFLTRDYKWMKETAKIKLVASKS